VYALRDNPAPFLAALRFKPALVVSSFTVKARRRNEMSFIRLAEEQFADNWFDVLVARSPEAKIDRLAGLHDFGALILDTYEYENEAAAFEVLREYSQSHPLIMLSSEANLCRLIKAARTQFLTFRSSSAQRRRRTNPRECCTELPLPGLFNSAALAGDSPHSRQ